MLPFGNYLHCISWLCPSDPSYCSYNLINTLKTTDKISYFSPIIINFGLIIRIV